MSYHKVPAGTFQTIVLSIPGVGRWVWTEAVQLVEFYPHRRVTADHELTIVLLDDRNDADHALHMAAHCTSKVAFRKKYSPSQRLKRVERE